MKKYPIKGADVLLYIGKELIAGQRNTTLNISADSIDTTTKDNGGWKTSLAGLREWSASLDAIELAGNEGKQQVALMKAVLDGRTIEARVVVPNKFVLSGAAAITSKDTSGDYGDVSTSSYELKGADAPDIDYVPFIDSATASSTTLTIKLTENGSSMVADKTLKDSITLKDESGSDVAISSAELNNGTITATLGSAVSSASKYEVEILGGSIKNGNAVQAMPLSCEITAAV